MKKFFITLCLMSALLSACNKDDAKKVIVENATVKNPVSEAYWLTLCSATTSDSELGKSIASTCSQKGYTLHAPIK